MNYFCLYSELFLIFICTGLMVKMVYVIVVETLVLLCCNVDELYSQWKSIIRQVNQFSFDSLCCVRVS